MLLKWCAGDGREAHIYDGRSDTVDSEFEKLSMNRGTGPDQDAVGEIHYLRDSDDERPDSDEDPDDDLDI
jgi:elongator complex protein 5